MAVFPRMHDGRQGLGLNNNPMLGSRNLGGSEGGPIPTALFYAEGIHIPLRTGRHLPANETPFKWPMMALH